MVIDQTILSGIKAAGVIGAGGAGFPTYKKLETKVEHIIANGAECEPLLYKDRTCMQQEPESFIRGLEIMRALTDAANVTIALKKKNEDLLPILRPLAEPEGIDFLVYRDVYPAGDEYLLVYEVTGRRIPPGGIPLNVGAIVNNVETIINVAHAADGQPVTRKYLTVAGAVENPLTMDVPVGITFRECLDAAGGSTVDNPHIFTGGVMMGGHMTDLSCPVNKKTGALIVLPGDHYLVRRKTASRTTYTRIGHGQCDQCSLCTEMCPRYIMGYPIEPHRVMRTLLMTGNARDQGSLWAQFCCECNVCSLVACPEMLDPKNICVDAKQLLREANLQRSEDDLDKLFREVHPARSGREIPIKTLYQRLGLNRYDRAAPFRNQPLATHNVVIPLNSHVGVPAVPSVAIGDRVEAGEIIGTVGDENLGCPAHASISGTVTRIDDSGIHIQN